MSTDGGTMANALLYVVALMAAITGVEGRTGDVPKLLRHPSRTVLLVWAAVAVTSAIQFAWPTLPHVLARRPTVIRDQHEYWRLVTSALVQDGGLFGSVFNLVVLHIVVCVAVRVRGVATTCSVFVAGAVVANVVAAYALDAARGR